MYILCYTSELGQRSHSSLVCVAIVDHRVSGTRWATSRGRRPWKYMHTLPFFFVLIFLKVCRGFLLSVFGGHYFSPRPKRRLGRMGARQLVISRRDHPSVGEASSQDELVEDDEDVDEYQGC